MLRAMRSALGASSNSLLCLSPSWPPHPNDRIKRSGVESGKKTPPPTGSYPGVRSGWADRGRVARCGVWGVRSLGDEWSNKREEASKEEVFLFFFFLFFFQIKLYIL